MTCARPDPFPEITDTGSRGIGAFISTCSDCPDYSTRVLISVFEV